MSVHARRLYGRSETIYSTATGNRGRVALRVGIVIGKRLSPFRLARLGTQGPRRGVGLAPMEGNSCI